MIKGTSLDVLFSKLIDLFIEKHKVGFKLRQVNLSRAKVVELALLKFLENRGELEQYLEELGESDYVKENIKEYLDSVK